MSRSLLEALDAAAHMSRFSGTSARRAQDALEHTWRTLQGSEEPLESLLRRAEAQRGGKSMAQVVLGGSSQDGLRACLSHALRLLDNKGTKRAKS